MGSIGLALNEGKTCVRDARCESFDFLGYTFGPMPSPRTGGRYNGARPSKKAIASIKAAIRLELRPGNQAPWAEVASRLNRTVRGWAAYFCYGSVAKARHDVQVHLYHAMAARKARDHGGYREGEPAQESRRPRTAPRSRPQGGAQVMDRKLAAILNADVQGYSRLMGDDEAARVRTTADYREVMTDLVGRHRGRVVDFTGDNLLAEFASAADSVQCAVKIQEALGARNATLPESRRMSFRIGINLGDVIVEGDRICNPSRNPGDLERDVVDLRRLGLK